MTIEANNTSNTKKVLPIIIWFYALFIFSIPFETLRGRKVEVVLLQLQN